MRCRPQAPWLKACSQPYIEAVLVDEELADQLLLDGLESVSSDSKAPVQDAARRVGGLNLSALCLSVEYRA